MPRHTGTLLLLLGLFLLPLNALADQLKLKNGDILTGNIIKKETDKLIFKTAYAGELSISWTEVASVRSDKPLRIVLTDDSNMKGRLAPSAAGKASVLQKDTQVAQIDLSKLLYINPSAEVSGVGITWSGRVNLGGTFTQGNSNTGTLHFDAESVVRRKHDRLTVGAVVNRAKSEGFDTEFNSRGYSKYDYFVSRKWYDYVNASAENDKFRDIRLRTNTGVGTGYQIFEQPDLNLSLEGGINYIKVNYYNDEDESYPGGRWALKYDQRIFSGGTQIFHEHEFLFDFLNGEHNLFFSKTGLRVPIAKNLNASTQLNIDWAQMPAPGSKNTDAALIFSLGYGW